MLIPFLFYLCSTRLCDLTIKTLTAKTIVFNSKYLLVLGGGIFMTVNFVVHSLMYTYYAVRAAGFKVPKPIAIVITASQVKGFLL